MEIIILILMKHFHAVILAKKKNELEQVNESQALIQVYYTCAAREMHIYYKDHLSQWIMKLCQQSTLLWFLINVNEIHLPYSTLHFT